MYDQNKFESNNEIVNQVNKLILQRYSTFTASGDIESIQKVRAFQQYFDEVVEKLENPSEKKISEKSH